MPHINKVMDLRTLCGPRIISNATTDNATEILQLSNRHFDKALKMGVMDFIHSHSDAVFRTEGWKKFEAMTDDSILKRLTPYRIPVALQEEVERQIHELLETGLIEHSDSDWAHPVVCVAKKNGNVRFCVD
ncbi:hypothetical protein AVEN_18876-1 [Araneus ventricosus]|uniref:Uncharacterized protein n=1 Tax=Araneus ventricosus TaxID=182803 RepID=A0A4Y2U563_ARAVE|nr:hypothetical protein AVEN_18876-1 [Araneus ventricosus]